MPVAFSTFHEVSARGRRLYLRVIASLVTNRSHLDDDANACKRARAGRRAIGLADGQAASHPLSLRLELAREEERARVARELHDELGQVLTSLKLEFMWLVDQLRNSEPKPGIQLVNKLQSLIGLIEVSIQSVRQISSDLRPAVLDHLGLRGSDAVGSDEIPGANRHPMPGVAGS